MDEDWLFDTDFILGQEGLLASNTNGGEAASEENGNNSVNNPNNNNSGNTTNGNNSSTSRRSNKNLTLQQRNHVVQQLLEHIEGNKVPHGFLKKLAENIGVHKSTISRLFKDLKTQRQAGEVIDVRNKKIGKSGRKPKEYDETFLQSVPLHLRTTIRAFAGALKVPPIVVHRLLKKGKLRSHTSNNHPKLTENHKISRMIWVLQHIHPGSNGTQAEFHDMRNVIHIDEKWFYLNPEKRRFILLPREDNPYRCQQSKRYKIKVMFMGVVSRPLYDTAGNLLHDGKFGIYPLVTYERAKKTSKNRAAGTLETKPILNVTQVVIRKLLVDKIIPDIKAKWPEQLSKEIFIQQDNARPHITGMDDEFQRVATSNGFKIQLVFQPPQSPDLNVLDLGLFNGFQSIQYHSFPKTVEELIEKVEEAYEWYEPRQMHYCWLQLQHCMVEILKSRGSNGYKIPHVGKERLDRLGQLPENVSLPQEIVDDAVNYLNERFINANNMEAEMVEQMGVDED